MSDLFAPAPAAARQRTAPAPKVDKSETKSAADPREHRCQLCDAWGLFGFGVSLRKGKAGLWACMKHRDEVARMTASGSEAAPDFKMKAD